MYEVSQVFARSPRGPSYRRSAAAVPALTGADLKRRRLRSCAAPYQAGIQPPNASPWDSPQLSATFSSYTPPIRLKLRPLSHIMIAH
eukprot:scaffold3307_cov265-Pinguiococcus_pyrenoidosus.AAC.3